jgi:hypothetical protein
VHKRTAAEVRTDIGAGTVTSVGLSSATSGVTIGSTPITTSGTITLAIATASGSQNGLLSSSDWTTFNGKQNALTNPVTGTGTSGQIAYFTGTSAISSESTLFWDATNDRLGINTNNPQFKIDILNGDIRLNMSSGNFGIIFEGDAGLLVEGTKIWYENNTGIQYYDSYWTGAGAGHFFRTNLNGTIQNVLKLNNTGTAVFINSVTATSFIRTGGTSSQFLKADGSIDSTAYGTGTVTSVTASSPLFSSGGATPNITIQQASGSQSGFLSSTDWTTFNGKQNLLTNPVTGTGTTNTLAKFTGSTTIGNSLLTDNGTNAGYNNAGVAARTFIIQATSGRPLALEVIENANVHAIYLYPNNGGFNRISSDYMSGGVFLPLSLTGRENNADLVLQTNGNVTIGTTTDAGFKLDVNGTGRFSGSTTFSISGATNNILISQSTITPSYGVISLNGITTEGSYIGIAGGGGTDKSLYLQSGNGGDLIFRTGNGSSFSNKLTIANAGAAAFSSSVTATNYIASAGNDSVIFSSSAATTGYQYMSLANTGAQLYMGINNSAGSLLTGSSAYASFISTGLGSTSLQLGTNNAIKMTILSGGNVGIGTNNPGQKLQVEGSLLVNSGTSASAFRDIMIGGIAGWSGGESHGIDTVYNTATSPITFSRIESHFDGTSGRFRFRNLFFSSAPRTDILMTIEGNGNVLIGTTTDPGYKLRVNGTTFTNDIRTFLPEADSVSTPWRFGTASIATIIPNRRLRVNVGGVEYYIGAVEV